MLSRREFIAWITNVVIAKNPRDTLKHATLHVEPR